METSVGVLVLVLARELTPDGGGSTEEAERRPTLAAAAGERWGDRAGNAWRRQEQHPGGYRLREAAGCQSPAPGFALRRANAGETGPRWCCAEAELCC